MNHEIVSSEMIKYSAVRSYFERQAKQVNWKVNDVLKEGNILLVAYLKLKESL